MIVLLYGMMIVAVAAAFKMALSGFHVLILLMQAYPQIERRQDLKLLVEQANSKSLSPSAGVSSMRQIVKERRDVFSQEFSDKLESVYQRSLADQKLCFTIWGLMVFFGFLCGFLGK